MLTKALRLFELRRVPLSQHTFYLVPHVFDIVAIVLAVSVAHQRLLLVPMES
jgi:hypothetical protein